MSDDLVSYLRSEANQPPYQYDMGHTPDSKRLLAAAQLIERWGGALEEIALFPNYSGTAVAFKRIARLALEAQP